MKLKIFLFPLTIIIAITFFVYFIKPAWGDYGKHKNDFVDSAENLKLMKKNKAKLSGVLGQYQKIKSSKKKLIRNSISNGISEEDFLNELKEIISSNNIQLIKVELIKPKKRIEEDSGQKPDEVSKINLELSFLGRYFQLKKSLYEIENANRFVQIKDLTIISEKDSEDLIMGVDLVAFYRPKESQKKLDLNNQYLKNIITKGLNIDLIDKYMNYREKVVNFDFEKGSNIGKDNLFGSSGGQSSGVEDLVKKSSEKDEESSGEEVEVSQEEVSDNSEETDKTTETD